jgi:hypothetical protein
LKRDIEQLTETIRELQRALIRGALPEHPVLHERCDGTEDVERFVVDYGCTPEQALERGALMLVVMRHFCVPHSTADDRPLGRTLAEPRRGDNVPSDPVTPPLPPTGADRPAHEWPLEPNTRQSSIERHRPVRK